jgi:hypothetical protein
MATTWLGIRRKEGELSAELYTSDGEHQASYRLGKDAGQILSPVVIREAAMVVSSSGAVWRIDASGAHAFSKLADDNIQYALAVEDNLFAVSQSGQGVAVSSVRWDGRLGPRFAIERLVDVSCPPMATKGRLILVGRQPDKIFNLDALTLRTGFQPTHGYLNVEGAIAFDNGEDGFVALAGGDQNQKAVTIVNTRSGHLVAQPFRTTGRASIKMIAAHGMLIVANSQPGDNRIRAYELRGG